MSDSLAADPDEHLTDGWEPDTPDSDTLVRAAVEAHAAWIGADRRRPRAGPGGVPTRWVGACVGDRGELTNVVLPLRPHGPGRLRGAGSARSAELVPPTAPYLLLSPFPTPDLSRTGWSASVTRR